MATTQQDNLRTTRNARRRGGAVLEVSLVLPILLMLTFGGIEWGYYLFVKNSLLGAAREGARTAIIAGTGNTTINTSINTAMDSATMSHIKTHASYVRTIQVLDSSGNQVSTDASTAATGAPIKVTVQCQWSATNISLLPTMLGGVPSTKMITASAVMRRE
ncbi:MAG: TadE/TadG family type IV pilus assembly protein [Tepidisphaeraceae bacterium]